MRILDDVKLDFNDVLIVPKRSKMPSRKNVQLEKTYTFLNSGRTWQGVPIIASNMDTTGTFAMAGILSQYNMLTSIHKHYNLDSLKAFFINPANSKQAFYTLGIKDVDIEKLDAFASKLGHSGRKLCPINITIDAANGYTEYFQDRVKMIRERCPGSIIMAGNVATPEMVSELLISGGADIVKVGIGSGGVCTTRKMTGVGYPQLSAILECADAAHGLGGHICADGGCREPGDIVKSFGAGADFVMLGTMLAGCDECEGEWAYEHQKKKKLKFYGMSSKEAQEKYDNGLAKYRAAEGKCTEVEYKGSVSTILQDIEGGLRSACAYVGANTLKDLPKCTTFVRVNRTYNNI